MLNDVNFSFPGGFAVLMALYFRDDSELFEMAVDSVFANTLSPDKFLIVVDGPLTENLENMLETLNNRYANRFDLLRIPKNIGLAHALNLGINHIDLPWIVRADSDDFNLPNRFLKLASLLSIDSTLELIGSSILEVEPSGKPVAVREVPESEADIREFVKTRNPFNHMSVAYRRETVIECGGYPNVYLKEDYALWCRILAKNIHVANTSAILVHATAGNDMYKRRGGWSYAKAEWHMQKELVSCHLKSIPKAFVDGILRGMVFLGPVWFRGWIYERFLRKTF